MSHFRELQAASASKVRMVLQVHERPLASSGNFWQNFAGIYQEAASDVKRQLPSRAKSIVRVLSSSAVRSPPVRSARPEKKSNTKQTKQNKTKQKGPQSPTQQHSSKIARIVTGLAPQFNLGQKCPFARRSTRRIISAEGPPQEPKACSIGAKASPENSCLYASSHKSYILVRPRSLARKGVPF
jgi:hypothetical protein